MNLRRALLIEDNAEVRRAVTRMLAQCGYEVLVADSVAMGRRLLDEARDLALMLTDHDLPDGTGLSVARLARGQGKHLPILIMTGGNTLDGLAVTFPVLRKPFSVTTLQAAIELAVAVASHPA